jgi:hypothetical protein
LTGFGLRFTVNLSRVSLSTESQIILHNLKKETRDALRTPNLRVMLTVGWPTWAAPQTIFVGALMRAVTVRYGPSLLTTLHCRTAADALMNTIIARTEPSGQSGGITFKGGSAVKDAVVYLASLLPGLNKDASGKIRTDRISVDRDSEHVEKFGAAGRVFAGTVRQALDDLSREFGFSWSVQNGTFQAIHDKNAFGRVFRLSAADGTLISAMPILYSQMQLEVGVEAKALLIPNVLPGDQVYIQSPLLTPDLCGLRGIWEITYTGSPVEQEWTMTIRSRSFDPHNHPLKRPAWHLGLPWPSWWPPNG